MAITTWIFESEVNRYKSVSDKELNDLFQEVRSLDDRYYLSEREIEVKRLFRKPKKDILYTMYVRLFEEDFQVMNFCRDTKWSINTMVPASYIYAYFYGFLGGLKSKIKETKARINPI